MILRRLPDSRFSEVLPEWAGATVALLAGGPSLTVEQVERARAADVKIIAINDAYLLAPWAEVNWFADSQWWEWQTKGVAKPLLGLSADQVRERFAAFPGQKCSIEHGGDNIRDDAVHMVRKKLFPIGNEFVRPGSAFLALHLAILAGAKTVLLLGLDGGPNAEGKTHWHGSHPKQSTDAVYEQQRRAFSAAEASIRETGARVLNCAPGSRLDSFEKIPLEMALAGIVRLKEACAWTS